MNEQQWRAAQRELRLAVGPAASGQQPSTAQPLVSVIVVAWNAADVLARCLDHLFAQDYVNREIIVVDDGSDDETARVAEGAATRGEMALLRSRRNRGCPAARNLGMRRARGKIVAFVDADGFAAPSWLSEVVAAFGEDAQIGGIASTVFYDDNPLVINGAGGTVNRQGWAADLSMNESYEDASIAAEALYPMGCGMALRREALERVGPFDDRMLNYYDDVDYGTRLWRAGYTVAVAADAWIDHSGAAAGGDSARKRLWCERHRMRVVLKHAPASSLATWASWELRGLLTAAMSVRRQKLSAIAWNVRHLPSALGSRWRLRGAPSAPEALADASWGDGFPVGVPLRLRPEPQRAEAGIDMAEHDAERQLLHGWFPAERVGKRSYRWAATSAAALVHLDAPARRLRLDYAHVPVDIGAIDLSIRRVGSAEPLAAVWEARLPWQYLARSVENHPLTLAPGDYEVRFASARGWSDPPRETRSLAFALSSLGFAGSFDVAPGGLDMAGAAADEQLVSGWFEPEDGPAGRYRWANGRASAVVRLAEPARSARLSYRLPPGPIGNVRVVLTPLGEGDEAWSTELAWRDGDWHEDAFALELAAGDYLLSFAAEKTWSNPEGRDAGLPPENRSLGLALCSLSFVAGALR
jgi:GT2 family glycosyltransferase